LGDIYGTAFQKLFKPYILNRTPYSFRLWRVKFLSLILLWWLLLSLYLSKADVSKTAYMSYIVENCLVTLLKWKPCCL